VSAGLVLQVLITGIATGAVIGLVATGFSLVYRMTGVLQFAHGDVAGAAAFVGILVATGTGPVASSHAGAARTIAAFAAAIAVAAVAGAGLYIAVRRASSRNEAFGWIAATTALAFLIEGALSAAFPREAYTLPDPFGLSRRAPIALPGGATLQPRTLVVLAAGIAIALVARALLTRTSFGIAVSAIASEPLAARAAGLRVARLVATGFAAAGALAAVAGLVGTPGGGTITVQTGAILGLKAVAAALLGGLANPDAVFAAAIGIGILEEAVTSLHVPGAPSWMLGPAWRDVVPLLLVLVVLAVRAPRDAREAVE
jgi:branched-chain amino acid transport system permease protein